MIEPRDFFSAKEHNLKTFLKDENKTIYVPDYQRNFAWTSDELEQLWDDIKKTFEFAYDSNFDLKLSPKPHFFGTLLLTRGEPGKFEVTDGQQRLTASTIFLKTLLEQSFKTNNHNLITGIRSLIQPLLQSNDYGDPFKQRLFLDETVNDLYTNYILMSNDSSERRDYLRLYPIRQQNPPSAKQRLKEAHDYFTEKLLLEFPDNMDQELKDKKLIALTKTFTTLFSFLEITVKDKETAYTIFGTINNRGKDLTDSDIIKNEIFKSANSNQRNDIKDKWDQIIENINTEDLTDYLRFQYASMYGPVKKVNLFRVISELIQTTNSIDYLETLKVESEWYARVSLIGATYWNEKITKQLEAFKTLDVSHSLPLLLTAAILFNDDETKFERLVNATLVFCFRYFTIGRNSVENLEREIGTISKYLRQGQIDIDESIKMMANITSNQEFKTNFSNYKTKDSNLAFYILYNLEVNKRAGVIPLPHSASQHIEHIMPKKPSRAAARINEWGHVRHNPEFNDYVFRLGNLLILESEKNQQVGNKVFSDKKLIYLESQLYYPAVVADTNTSWDFASISSRQNTLAHEALNVWRYY